MKNVYDLIQNKLLKSKEIESNNRQLEKEGCTELTKKLEDTILFIYYGIQDGIIWMNHLIDNNLYKLEYELIENKEDIPRPETFNDKFYPSNAREFMFENARLKINFKFKINNVNTNIILISDLKRNENIDKKLKNLFIDIKWIITWLYFSYNLSVCARTLNKLTIYFYKLDYPKSFPKNKNEILSGINVNSAYSHVCNGLSPNLEMVIFRSEEWFKVLIHETLHIFNLSLSSFDNNSAKILSSIFGLKVECLIEEVYAEFWARIINIIFKLVKVQTKYINIKVFLKEFERLLDIERSFSVIQSLKVLNYYNLKFSYFYEENNSNIEIIRKKQDYKEKTNVFCYYVITSLLMICSTRVIEWCYDNNIDIINFKKTKENRDSFIRIIKSILEDESTKQYIESTDLWLNKESNSMIKFNKSLRMTINDWIN